MVDSWEILETVFTPLPWFRVRCPVCGLVRDLRVVERPADGRIPCPGCRTRLAIPPAEDPQ